MMCRDYREFECARCETSVTICPSCDRGQRYCSPECSQPTRRESMRKAGQKYRQTAQGRLCGARRQARHRERHAKIKEDEPPILEEITESENLVSKKVTHQGSPLAVEGFTLYSTLAEGASASLAEQRQHACAGALPLLWWALPPCGPSRPRAATPPLKLWTAAEALEALVCLHDPGGLE